MVKLSSTLESSRKDKRLANSDNIYDKKLGKMQEEINQEVSSLSPVDEEDLTRSYNDKGRSVTKFADRSYSPQDFSGKGYKILRKNIKPVSLAVTKIIVSSVPTSDGYMSFIINGIESHVDVVTSSDTTTDKVADKIVAKLTETMIEYEVSKDASTITLTRKFDGVISKHSSFSAVSTGASCSITDSTKEEFRNILSPNMINQPNTIYEIRYDFDLDGATLEIYNGCILEFKGGKLKNGTLKGTNTQLNAAPSLIFNNVTFNGRWRIYNYFPEWFISDFSDCTDGIQQAIDFASINNGGKIVFLSRQYNVKSIHTGIKTNLIGSGIGATIIKQIEGTNKSLIDLPASSAGILIANMTLKGNNETGCHGISKVEKSFGGENHEYIYSEVTSYDEQIAFRWSTFRNLAIYNFDRGIYLSLIHI